MNDSSSITSKNTGLTLNVPVPDGVTTEETFTVLVTVHSDPSQSNVKIRSRWTSQAGWGSWSESVTQTVDNLEQLFTRNEDKQMQHSSTPVSHSGCWCNSSRKRDTSNGSMVHSHMD